MKYWALSIDEIFKALGSSKNGLSEKEALSRLHKYGKNELKKEKTNSFKVFLRQFKSFLIIILFIASLISFFVGNQLDAMIILAIVFFNGIIGFLQEYHAEKSIEMLKKLISDTITVIRDGKKKEIDVTNLVPGDIVMLEEGDKIPADCRIIWQENLKIDESSLTGESIPVSKTTEICKEDSVLAERKNSLFSGTSVVNGRCIAIVVNTGMQTELGKIAKQIQVESPPTPLQKYLDEFGKKIILAVLIIVSIIFFISYFFKAGDFITILLTSVSLAVAAVPEGLPAIITLSSAIGVKRMVKRKTLVRRLLAIESLGTVTVIATDKTGTLTENKMKVQKVYYSGKITSVKLCKSDMLFRIGLVCNNADLERGDPTERALIDSAKEFGLNTKKERKMYVRIKEIPFSSIRKRMAVVCKYNSKTFSFVKGAPDVVINLCNRIMINGKVRKITKKDKMQIIKVLNLLASKGLRVIAFAYKESGEEPEKNSIFVGMQGMIDPPRKEVKNAIKVCKEAGIRVIMITGDHPLTAKNIASEIGMEIGGIVSGEELNKMDEKTFDEIVNKANIFARIEPSQKLKIVQKLREKGEIVAVTGDGINDAPALKNSDIGIAMGIRGSDVAKEASDMVILDDNFATIVSAVEEGRRIFDNIKKSINYLLSNNFGEVLIVFLASLFLLPLPITAIQLLWINLLTDGFPAIALGLDPAKKGIMKEKRKRTKIIDKIMFITILQTGILITIGSLYLFKIGLIDNLMKAQTIVFTTLVLFQFIRLIVIETEYNMSIFSNKYLLFALIVSLILQLTVIYTPLSQYFKTVSLSLYDWKNILLTLFVIGIVNYSLARLISKKL